MEICQLPSKLRERIESELGSKETILWLQQPSPSRLKTILTALFINVSLIIFGFFMVIIPLDELSKIFMSEFSFGTPFKVLLLGFIFYMGIRFLTGHLWRSMKAVEENAVYVLTNKRAFLVDDEMVRSYTIEQLKNVYINVDSKGNGAIVFSFYEEAERLMDVTFEDIVNVQEVETMIKDLTEQEVKSTSNRCNSDQFGNSQNESQMKIAQLPSELGKIVEAKLGSKETILWLQQPSLSILKEVFPTRLGIMLTGFCFIILMIFGNNEQLVLILFGFFSLIGIVVLSIPLWVNISAKKNTVYILTDKRAILFEKNWISFKIKSYTPQQLKDVYINEDKKGHGDVIFERETRDVQGPQGGTLKEVTEIGFRGIMDVQKVEKMVKSWAEERVKDTSNECNSDQFGNSRNESRVEHTSNKCNSDQFSNSRNESQKRFYKLPIEMRKMVESELDSKETILWLQLLLPSMLSAFSTLMKKPEKYTISTLYVLTDKRAILFEKTQTPLNPSEIKSYTPEQWENYTNNAGHFEVKSYTPKQMKNVYVKNEDKKGKGDVIFEEVGFINVTNVREVEKIVKYLVEREL
ncbi:hypothetical protein QUF50_00160 [Thiotrichales bacterium HSG1]|nr:hypothetical protein [Thiotrichales bacterium HSG1]